MKKVVSYLPLLYVCYLFLSFTHLINYYKVFHVEIISFVSISDVLFIFIPKFIIISASYYFYILSFVLNQRDEDKNIKAPQSRFYRVSFIIIAYLLINSLLSILILFFNWKGFKFELIYYLFDVAFIILGYFAAVKYDKDSFVFKSQFALTIGIIFLISYKIGQYSVFTAERKKSNTEPNEIKFSFIYNNDTISTDLNTILIGQTSSDIFIYNKIDSTTTIYPLQKIELFKIK